MPRNDVSGVWLDGISKNVLLCAIMISLVPAAGGLPVTCGGCAFQLEGEPNVNAVLSKTASCEDTCTTSLGFQRQGIVSIANGTFHGMTKLKYLHLQYNALASLPADAFKDNPELQELYLYSNALTNIHPDTFKYNAALFRLDLTSNALTSISADAFKNNTALVRLDLDLNAITSIHPDAFKYNTALEYLDLDHNSLTSFSAQTFKYNWNLQHLSLAWNALTSIPEDAFKYNSYLTSLFLDDNDLTSLPADAWKYNVWLQRISLSQNALTSIHPDAFKYNTALQEIDLYHNALTSILPDAFKHNTALYRLDLSNNALTSCNGSISADVFKYNTALQYLYLYNNAIASLPAEIFSQNVRLISLQIYGNPLGCIYGVPDSARQYLDTRAVSSGQSQTPECPSNCTIQSFYHSDANVCQTCPPGSARSDGVGAVTCLNCSSKSRCSSKFDCAYDGCANRPCSSLSLYSFCINGVWDYECRGNTCYYNDSPAWGISHERYNECPDPRECAAGSYSANGLDFLHNGTCKPCAAGTFSSFSGATSCTPCPSDTTSPSGSTSLSDCMVSTSASTNCTLPVLPAQRQTGTGFVSTCSSMSTCNYKGCADIQCNSSLSSYAEQNCNNGVWDYFCSCVSGNTCSTAEGFCGNSGPGGISPGCSPPSPCAAGSYSANGLDYLGDGACKPCDAGTFAPCPGAKSCSHCPPGTSSTVYSYTHTHLLVTCIE